MAVLGLPANALARCQADDTSYYVHSRVVPDMPCLLLSDSKCCSVVAVLPAAKSLRKCSVLLCDSKCCGQPLHAMHVHCSKECGVVNVALALIC